MLSGYFASGHPGCGKRCMINYKGLDMEVSCGDNNFEEVMPLCEECRVLQKGVKKNE